MDVQKTTINAIRILSAEAIEAAKKEKLDIFLALCYILSSIVLQYDKRGR